MMSSTSRAIGACGCVLAWLLLAGGGRAETTPAAPTPAPTPAIKVTLSAKGAGINDVPLGAYRVPDSNIVISGRQKGGAAGLLLGPVGMLAQGAINTQAEKGAVGGVQNALRFDLAKLVEDDTRTALQSGQYGQAFTLEGVSTEAELTVYAYATVTFVNDTDARPFVVLKTVLKPLRPGGRQQTLRYICCGGEAFPLSGDKGLAANGGALLQQVLTREVDGAVNLMLTDTAHPYPRDEQRQVVVDAHFPLASKKFRVSGYELFEDQDSIVFSPRLSNMIVFAGVLKMDKSAISARPTANPKEFVFKILPD